MELTPGTHVGGNRLVERVGAHGAAEVWRACNSSGQEVTLRIGRVRGRSEAAVRDRLEADLAVAARARHPNIVRVLGAGVEDGWYYVVSEPVEGLLLRTVLEQARQHGPWPSPHLAGYVTHQLAKALVYVHELPGPDGQPLGALHRELNPGVVMIEPSGAVKLAELVSSLDSQDLVETASRAERGLVAYVSPEAVSRTQRTGRSDVFSLGAIFWELLTGRPPFSRETDLDTLEAVRTADIPPMSPGVPEELGQVARRCIQRDPKARYGSPWDVARALEVVLEGHRGAGPRALADLLRALSTSPAPARPRTEVLSEASQAPVGATGAPPDSNRASPAEDVADEADEAPAAKTAEGSADPFFDAERDADRVQNKRFEVRRRLGSGAMGHVFEVFDTELDETVALKRVPPELANSGQQLERLKREVRLARRIASEHVCRIFDIVDLGAGERGITMAVVEGVTLADLMRQPFEPDYERVAKWGADIADGLAAAHGLDIVHRDLKPENIMIRSTDDRAVLLDFGIARPKDQGEVQTKLTQKGIIMGTPLYMSPEQLLNQPLDGRSDLYSLGLILAELITGEVPLDGKNYVEILDRRARANAVYKLGDVAPGVPRALAELVDALLAPVLTARPATATAVKETLRAIASGRASDPPTPQSGEGPIAITPPGTWRPSETAARADTPSAPPETTAVAPLAAPAPDPWRYAMPAVLLALIALVLGFWVISERRAGPTEGRPAARPAEVDAAVAGAGAAPTERLEVAEDAPDAGLAPSDAGAPTPPDAGPPPTKTRKKKRRGLPPAEEM